MSASSVGSPGGNDDAVGGERKSKDKRHQGHSMTEASVSAMKVAGSPSAHDHTDKDKDVNMIVSDTISSGGAQDSAADSSGPNPKRKMSASELGTSDDRMKRAHTDGPPSAPGAGGGAAAAAPSPPPAAPAVESSGTVKAEVNGTASTLVTSTSVDQEESIPARV